MTDFLKFEERLYHIKYLAERKQTGSPQVLAAKFGVSKRTIKRMVDILRMKGIPIYYNRLLNSYQIKEEK